MNISLIFMAICFFIAATTIIVYNFIGFVLSIADIYGDLKKLKKT